MEVAVGAAALLAGLLIGAAVAYALGRGAGRRAARVPTAQPVPARPPSALTAELARRTVEVTRHGAVVVDAADDVVLANAAARGMGVV
ncbi:MAG: hypothetical protein LC713_05630, partial [Actinobacteria bacterium]|nr:hypothetical protein [Actinomycetota bacterium]